MLKRQEIKRPLIALVVLSSITVITQIVSIVYQGLTGFTGFNSGAVAQPCPIYALSFKLTFAYKLYQVSFIGLIASCCCLLAVEVVLVIGLVQFVRQGRQQAYKQPINTNTNTNNNNNQNNNTVQHDNTQPLQHASPSQSAYDGYFSYNKIVAGYMLYSLAILGVGVHFGLVLSVLISSIVCVGSMYLTLLIVCGLSALGLVLVAVCWVLWQVWRCKVHAYLDEHCQVEGGQGAITNADGNRNGKMGNNQIEMQHMNMNTMYPLKTDSDGNPVQDDPYADNYYHSNDNKNDGNSRRNNQQANYVSFQNKNNTTNNPVNPNDKKNTNTNNKNNNNNLNNLNKYNRQGSQQIHNQIQQQQHDSNNQGNHNDNNIDGNGDGSRDGDMNRNSATKQLRKQSNTNTNTNPNDINTNGHININININRGSAKQTEIFTLSGDSNKIQKKPTPKFIIGQNEEDYPVRANKNYNNPNNQRDPLAANQLPIYSNSKNIYNKGSPNKNNKGSPDKKGKISLDGKDPNNQIRGSPFNKEHYLSYLIEQNQSPEPKGNRDDALQGSGGKPFFKSSRKIMEKEKDYYPHKSPLEKYQDVPHKKSGVQMSRNLAPALSNNQPTKQSQKDKKQQSVSDKKLNQSISTQKLHEQQRKFFQTDNHNSLLRRDSLHESSNEQQQQKVVNLHKNMEREVNNQPKKQERYYDNPKAIKKNKKKGLLIDYIRSKYVD